MNSPIPLKCPSHHESLSWNKFKGEYHCISGCVFPVTEGIIRFVPANNYAKSFGTQWNVFSRTQLDSFTGLSISKDRLSRMVGGGLDCLRGKLVLEAGCGAGRFTEVMLNAGANVFAVDISTAVEANYQNCNQHSNYFVCQADVLKLPVAGEQFDVVVCIGVIQHTRSPEETMRTLCSHVKPGGLLVMDHYTYGYPATPSRRMLRSFLLGMSNTFSMGFCKTLTAVLWPVHKVLWNMKVIPGIEKLRSQFLYYSPIVDYHDAYPRLSSELLQEWAILDTHDTLTDYYKHLRSAEDIKKHLELSGMVEIETVYAGNGVEARARKPFRSGQSLMEIVNRCN